MKIICKENQTRNNKIRIHQKDEIRLIQIFEINFGFREKYKIINESGSLDYKKCWKYLSRRMQKMISNRLGNKHF